jgi:hypothetical protein
MKSRFGITSGMKQSLMPTLKFFEISSYEESVSHIMNLQNLENIRCANGPDTAKMIVIYFRLFLDLDLVFQSCQTWM